MAVDFTKLDEAVAEFKSDIIRQEMLRTNRVRAQEELQAVTEEANATVKRAQDALKVATDAEAASVGEITEDRQSIDAAMTEIANSLSIGGSN